MKAAIQGPLLFSQVFQCLLIEGENVGEGALREAEKFVISNEEFQEFLDRHRDVSCLVPECNDKVISSIRSFVPKRTLRLSPKRDICGPKGSAGHLEEGSRRWGCGLQTGAPFQLRGL